MPEDEPFLSADVAIRPTVSEAGDESPPNQETLAKVKAHFTSSGFEVHAPFWSRFSIAGRRSFFEQFFGTRLVVDEEALIQTVTTETGERELPVVVLPPEVRQHVASISFIPPPDLPAP